MTLEEAQSAKVEAQKEATKQNPNVIVYVVPSISTDNVAFFKALLSIKDRTYQNEQAEIYSTNNDFEIYFSL